MRGWFESRWEVNAVQAVRRATGRWLCALVALAAVLSGMRTEAAATESVWELTPYRIRVVLEFDEAAELTPGLEADLRKGLANETDLLIGAPWVLSLTSAPVPLKDQMIGDMESVTLESLSPEWLADDKVALLTVGVVVDGYRITGRELDVRTQVWSPVIAETVHHPARLRDTLFGVLERVFAPLGQIEAVEGETVTLRLRAANLAPRDPTCLVTPTGTIFQPIVRYNDREGNARKVAPAPWSFLVATEIQGADAKCKLHTGIRSPLSAQRRGRMEQLALAIIPSGDATSLVLHSRTDKEKPLAGYQVYRQLGDSKSTAFLGRTDRRGALLLKPDKDPALRTVVIRNGDEVLAKLPLVIGLEREVVAPIADDDQRLEAEGFLIGFQENLVDLVTRRAMLRVQIRARIRAGEFDKAEALLGELRKLKGRDECLMDLAREKQKVFSKDKVVQRKIDKLFTDTETLLKQHLDSTMVEQLVRELAEARKGHSQDAATNERRGEGPVSGATAESTRRASQSPQEPWAAEQG